MSHQSKVRRFLVLPGFLACFFFAADARAQYSDDPAANLSVTDRTGEQVQPKIVPTSDGAAATSAAAAHIRCQPIVRSPIDR